LPAEKLTTTTPELPAGVNLMSPKIQYQGKVHQFEPATTEEINLTANGHTLTGVTKKFDFKLPNTEEIGHALIHHYTTDGTDGIYFSMKFQYPYTTENAYVFNEIAALQRPQDDDWNEVCPFEISVANGGDAFIIKRNYEGDISEFAMRSFADADSRNKNLDSFNHQVTNGIVGVRTGQGGFLLAVQKQVANSMAFCPMRLIDGTLYLNPFGTYGGKQRHHATHGNGLGAQAAVFAAPQFFPLAPAYNGAQEAFMMAIFPFENEPTAGLWQQAIDFSEGSLPVADLKKDFSKSHPPKEMAANIKLKKLTSGVPLSLQAKIFKSGVKSRFIGGK